MMLRALATSATLLCVALGGVDGASRVMGARSAVVARASRARARMEAPANKNVAQTLETSRDKIMTFVYDEDEQAAAKAAERKPARAGTGNGMSGGGDGNDEYDVIVIGSGVGGLACAALTAKYGDRVLCVESHIKAGGSAHTFTRKHEGGEYSFEVGPSIFEGLNEPSINPLRMIIDILGEELPSTTYKGIGYWTPEGHWRFPIGSLEQFEATLREQCGEDGELAIAQWNALRERLRTLSGSTKAVSLLNLRQDIGFLATTAGSLPYVARHPDIFGDLTMLFDSLHKVVDEYVTVPFLRNFIDTMCIFCGFPAKGAMTAHMLYILERFFDPEAAFTVPLGGTCGIADALVRGLEKFGGKLELNAHVEKVLVEDGRATGITLRNGKTVRAKKAVVANLTPFDVAKLLRQSEEEKAKAPLPPAVAEWTAQFAKLPRHGAIMHLFVAIDATDLDLSHIPDAAQLVVQDWSRSLQDSQNLCSFFIPSLVDPSVCPPGKHVIHVYSSGGEPYEPWEGLADGSPEYEAYKAERAEVLWRAVERAIPDVRQRAEFHVIGSPLAHEAFLRRDRGTYGMAWAAGKAAPYSGLLQCARETRAPARARPRARSARQLRPR